MGGIPWQSKGCRTCRKRKIKVGICLFFLFACWRDSLATVTDWESSAINRNPSAHGA